VAGQFANFGAAGAAAFLPMQGRRRCRFSRLMGGHLLPGRLARAGSPARWAAAECRRAAGAMGSPARWGRRRRRGDWRDGLPGAMGFPGGRGDGLPGAAGPWRQGRFPKHGFGGGFAGFFGGGTAPKGPPPFRAMAVIENQSFPLAPDGRTKTREAYCLHSS